MQVYNTWIVSVMKQKNKYRLQILVVGKDLTCQSRFHTVRSPNITACLFVRTALVCVFVVLEFSCLECV